MLWGTGAGPSRKKDGNRIERQSGSLPVSIQVLAAGHPQFTAGDVGGSSEQVASLRSQGRVF